MTQHLITLFSLVKKFYIKLLSEDGLNGDTPSKTYSQVPIIKEEILNANITNCKKLAIHVSVSDKTVPIMYWLPKMHKTLIGSRFVNAFETGATKESML